MQKKFYAPINCWKYKLINMNKYVCLLCVLEAREFTFKKMVKTLNILWKLCMTPTSPSLHVSSSEKNESDFLIDLQILNIKLIN